ncbi:MAG: hypothetical protein U0324_29890 [Polyangiales bacterium]
MLPSDEPDDRVPCPDGACTGVLGPDGRACGTCGRAGERPPIASAATSETPAPVTPAPTDADRDAALEANPEAILESAAAATSADGDERVPSRRRSCTGVIGPDGRCGTCGRRAA